MAIIKNPLTIVQQGGGGINIPGWTFRNGFDHTSIYDYLSNLKDVDIIDDHNITQLDADYFLYKSKASRVTFHELISYNYNYCYLLKDTTNLEYASFPKLRQMSGVADDIFMRSSIKEAHFPSMTSLPQNFMSSTIPNIKYVDITNVQISATGIFKSSPNLITVINHPTSLRDYEHLRFWNPTNALRDDSSSLVESGESFSSNLEKLLYNIRQIASYLPETNDKTFTFWNAVYNAINADSPTLSAFTDKGWTLLSKS